MKLISAVTLSVLLAVASAYPQAPSSRLFSSPLPAPAPAPHFPSAPATENIQSFGLFKIHVLNKYASLFQGCQYFDSATRTFTSPVLYDAATEITLSWVGPEADAPGRPERPGMSDQLILPSTFKEPPDGNREVHTEITNLKMVGSGFTVRAGKSYNNDGQLPTDRWRSHGEVFSKAPAGHIGDPNYDFPAESYFNVFVNIGIPECGHVHAGTLYNQVPLIVSTDPLQGLPPTVIYEHDSSSAVPVYLRQLSPPFGRVRRRPDEIIGYVVLAGHQVAPSLSNTPQNQQNFKETVLRQRQAPLPCE